MAVRSSSGVPDVLRIQANLEKRILQTIEAMEVDSSLREPSHFAQRVESLDLLDTLVFPESGVPLPIGPGPDSLADVHARAMLLREELEDLNRSFCEAIRRGISSGRLRGEALHELLLRYAGEDSEAETMDDQGYNALDELVGGVFMAAPAAEPTVQLHQDMVAYQPTPARIILDLVSAAGFRSGDVFCDVGSGLGHVVLLVHLLTGVRAQGIEIEPAYYDYACRCADALEISGVEFCNLDARDTRLTGPNHFFLYTPFTGHLLNEFLLILRSQAATRKLHVYGYGPCTPEVAHHAWLKSIRKCGSSPQGLTHFVSMLPLDGSTGTD